MYRRIGIFAVLLAAGMAGEAQSGKISSGNGSSSRGKTETRQLGAGIAATRILSGNRTMIRVTRGSGGGIMAPSDPGKPLATEAARVLNLRVLPATGMIDRETLVARGILRPATSGDVMAWEQKAKNRGGFGAARVARDKGTVYVLQRPVRGTDLLTSAAVGAPKETPLIIPAHLSIEQAPLGASGYYRMRDGQCIGKDTGCRPFHDTAQDVSLATCLPGVDRNVEIHAFGVYQGKRHDDLNVRVGTRKDHKTGQVDIYVAPTAQPVVLTLGSYEPVIWAIHEAAGARVAGVLVRGYHDQAVAGTEAPVRFSTRRSGSAEGCGSYRSSYKAGAKRAAWAAETRALFGHGVSGFDGGYSGRIFAVGAWDNLENAKPLPIDFETVRTSGAIKETSAMDDMPANRLLLLGLGVFIFRRQIMNYING